MIFQLLGGPFCGEEGMTQPQVMVISRKGRIYKRSGKVTSQGVVLFEHSNETVLAEGGAK